MNTLEGLLNNKGHDGSTKDIFKPPPLRMATSLVLNQSYEVLRKIMEHSRKPGDGEGEYKSNDNSDGYTFLIDGGVNVDKINNSFKKLEQIPVKEIHHEYAPCMGIEHYLQSRHQKAIESIITRSRQRINKQHTAFFNSVFLNSWEEMKREIIRSLDRADTFSHSTFEDGSIVKALKIPMRLKSNSECLKELNSCLLNEKEYDVMLKFFTGQGPSNEVEVDPKIRMCWVILDRLLNPSDSGKMEEEVLLNRNYFAKFDLKNSNDSRNAKLRHRIARDARCWIEEIYLNRILSVLTNTRADNGGLASIDKQIYAYLKRMMMHSGTWADDLEVHNDDPIWAHLFFYVRSGRRDGARKYICKNESAFKESSESFLEYFLSYLDSENGVLDKRLHDSLSREWTRIKRYGTTTDVDPFKYILFKLIGRFELQSIIASNPVYMSSIDDYIWLLLMLVDENKQFEDKEEVYGLRDVAVKIKAMSAKHFDNVIEHFHMLLLCGEFELAIAHLYDVGGYEVEAAHFAIALAYLGIISQCPFPSHLNSTAIPGPQVVLLSGTKYTPVYLDYIKIISECALTAVSFDTNLALNYAYTLGIPGTPITQIELEQNVALTPDKLCTKKAIDTIKEIIVKSTNLDEIVGYLSDDGTVKHGTLLNYSPLIHIHSRDKYNSILIAGAAELAKKMENYPLAVNLFNVALKFSSALDVINDLLSEQILLHEHPEQLIQKNAIDPEALSTPIVKIYERSPDISMMVDEKKIQTCVLLKKLYLFARLTKQNQHEEGFSILKESGIFPISGLPSDADNLRLEHLIEGVSSVLPAVVRMAIKTMNVLFRDAKVTQGDPIMQRVKQSCLSDVLKMANAMVRMAGGPSSPFPRDVLSSLSDFLRQTI